MKTHPRLRIILSTDELMEEYRQADTLFGTFRTTVKEVVEYCVDYWLNYPYTWESTDFTPIDQLSEFLEADFLRDIPYSPHSDDDRLIFLKLITAIGVTVYLEVIPIIDVMRLPDIVRTSLRSDGWLGDSLVVSTLGKPEYGATYLYASFPQPSRPHRSDVMSASALPRNAGVSEQHTCRLAALRRNSRDLYPIQRSL